MRSTGIAVFLVLAALGFFLLREGALHDELRTLKEAAKSETY